MTWPGRGPPPPVRETLIQLTHWPLSKGLELVFDVDDAQYRVTTDAGAINIALTNLVTNAANFSPEHGMITVELCKTARGWGPSVDDQGPGIDESQSERLFECFYSRGNAFDSPPAVHTPCRLHGAREWHSNPSTWLKLGVIQVDDSLLCTI
jgi:hypothetical protein